LKLFNVNIGDLFLDASNNSVDIALHIYLCQMSPSP